MVANRVVKRTGRTEFWATGISFILRVQFQSHFLQGLNVLSWRATHSFELQRAARPGNDHQSEVRSHIQGVYFDIHLYYFCNSCYTNSLVITLTRPWPILGCSPDDVDIDIPNEDQNVDLKFKILILLWVKIVHLFRKIRDRLNTVGWSLQKFEYFGIWVS